MFWPLAFWLFPLGAFLWARRRVPHRLWLITGATFGAIVSPASSALYGLYFVGPIAAIFGLLGLLLLLLHNPPGYNLAIQLGLFPPFTVVQGAAHTYIDLLNGVVWSLVYGAAGWGLDWFRGRRRPRDQAVTR